MTENRQEIVDALEEGGPMNGKQIAEAVGNDVGNTYKRLQDMVNAGLIDKNKHGREQIYSIKDKLEGSQQKNGKGY